MGCSDAMTMSQTSAAAIGVGQILPSLLGQYSLTFAADPGQHRALRQCRQPKAVPHDRDGLWLHALTGE